MFPHRTSSVFPFNTAYHTITKTRGKKGQTRRMFSQDFYATDYLFEKVVKRIKVKTKLSQAYSPDRIKRNRFILEKK
jgi:hypothetical protein